MSKDKDFETRSKGGKTAWAKVPKKERTRRMSELGKLRWKTKKTVRSVGVRGK